MVSKDPIHIHIEYPPRIVLSRLVKRMKGRSSRWLVQKEFRRLKQRYWGKHFWARGYGVLSKGDIADEMVQQYVDHHRSKDDKEN